MVDTNYLTALHNFFWDTKDEPSQLFTTQSFIETPSPNENTNQENSKFLSFPQNTQNFQTDDFPLSPIQNINSTSFFGDLCNFFLLKLCLSFIYFLK